MSKVNLPSIDYVRQCLSYNDGKLVWAEYRPPEHFKTSWAHKSWNRRFAGKVAGHTARIQSGDRIVICLDGKPHYRSILTWAIVYGEWPRGVVDHKNRITTDDNADNLRDATSSQNNMNRGLSRRNTSGVKGVRFDEKRKKWVSYIWKDGKNVGLGSFTDIIEAVSARKKAEAEIHGEFAVAPKDF